MDTIKKEKVLIQIGDEFIQEEAQQELERELTDEELEDVGEKIGENLWINIRDAICEVISYNELIDVNKNADKSFPHCKVYWRNIGAYQPQFKLLGAFRTKDEAVEYTRRARIGNSENEWDIVLIEAPGEVLPKKLQI